jgi:hypothetical protein
MIILFADIIFTNLLVSLLTFAYEKTEKDAILNIYMRTIAKVERLEYDSSYGCLVTTPFILQFTNIFFLIYSCFVKDEEKLKKKNRLFVKIGYIFVFLIAFQALLAVNLLFLPVFWLK